MKKTMTIIAALCIAMATNTACQKTNEASQKEADSKDAPRAEAVSTDAPQAETISTEMSQEDTEDTKPNPLSDEQILSQKLKKIFANEGAIYSSLPMDDYEKREKGFDKIRKEEAKFIEVLRQHPETLDYPEEKMAKLLGDGYTLATSPDGRVRTYSWDTGRGGSGYNTASITQFRSKSGKTYVTCEYERSAEEDLFDYEIRNEKDRSNPYSPWEWQSEVTKIYQLDTANGRIYLAYSNYVNSHVSCGYMLESLAITGEKMTRIPIFLIDGMKRANLTCEAYGEDCSSNKFLTFDQKNKRVSFYEYEDENPIVSNNLKKKSRITYKYDGKMFKQVK